MTIPEILPLPPCAIRNGESESAMVKAAIRSGFIAPYSSAAHDDWKANQYIQAGPAATVGSGITGLRGIGTLRITAQVEWATKPTAVFLSRLKPVTNARFIMEKTGSCRIVFELPPQLANIDAKILRIALLVASPDFSKQAVMRENAICMSNQESQKVVFGGGKMNVPPGNANLT